MHVGTLYTLYGRRAGAEMLFEKTIAGLLETSADIRFTIFCNREAAGVLAADEPRRTCRPVSWLNHQYGKAVWLEWLSRSVVDSAGLDVFWIPSGANHFPGRWRTPALVTFLDLGEYFVPNKYDRVRTYYRKQICIPRSVRRASAMNAISERTASDLQQLFSPSREPAVTYPGLSPQEPGDPKKDARTCVREETTLDVDQVIFVPGRTDYEGKGLDLVLTAYARLRSAHPDVPPLVMAGPPGMDQGRVEQDIRQLGIADAVHVVGRVSASCMDALYRLSEYVVIPSRYEGFGFPVLEAMQRRVPVISSDAGSLPEVAGEAALTFPSGDARALGECMERLHTDPKLRSDLSEKGLRQAEQFSWERYYGQMLQLLTSLAPLRAETPQGGTCLP